MVHRTSNANENTVSAVSSMAIRDSQSSTVERRAQQHAVQYPPRQRLVAQPMPSSVPERRPSGPSSLRLAQQNDRIVIASSDVIETLTNINADIRNKVFTRKPRNMVLHTPIAGVDMEDVMVTGSLDG